MISSIQNSASAYATLGANSISNTNKTENDTSADSSTLKMLTPDTDTVTISAEGSAYVSQSQSTSDTELLSSLTADEEDSTSTSDLSSYSQSQLAQMLSDGEITQAEYNAELQSRATTSATTEED